MKKILMAAILAVSFLISVPQVSAELVNVPGTTYYIFTETIEYDPAPKYLGKEIINGYNISVVGIRKINEKFPNGEYIKFKYIFKRSSDKTWSYRTNDTSQFPEAAWYESEKNIAHLEDGVLLSMLKKVIEYIPDREEIMSDLKNQDAVRASKIRDIEASDEPVPPVRVYILTEGEKAERAKLRANAESVVNQADEKFKAKDYSAAIQLFNQAIEINPKDGYTHYMLAKSLYREKNKNKDYNKIIDEIKTAIAFYENNNDLADYYSYLGKVYLKLAGQNLFNLDNKIDYSGYSRKCTEIAQNIRQSAMH